MQSDFYFLKAQISDTLLSKAIVTRNHVFMESNTGYLMPSIWRTDCISLQQFSICKNRPKYWSEQVCYHRGIYIIWLLTQDLDKPAFIGMLALSWFVKIVMRSPISINIKTGSFYTLSTFLCISWQEWFPSQNRNIRISCSISPYATKNEGKLHVKTGGRLLILQHHVLCLSALFLHDSF